MNYGAHGVHRPDRSLLFYGFVEEQERPPLAAEDLPDGFDPDSLTDPAYDGGWADSLAAARGCCAGVVEGGAGALRGLCVAWVHRASQALPGPPPPPLLLLRGVGAIALLCTLMRAEGMLRLPRPDDARLGWTLPPRMGCCAPALGCSVAP